jgi:hypothetical protein
VAGRTLTEGSLTEFLKLLQKQGFSFGVAEIIRAVTVFKFIELESETLPEPTELAALIGPAVCSSAQEQREFKLLFRTWLNSPAPIVSTNTRGKLPTIESFDTLERRATEGSKSAAEGHLEGAARRWWGAAALLGAVLLGVMLVRTLSPMLFGWMLAPLSHAGSPQPQAPESAPRIKGPAPNANSSGQEIPASAANSSRAEPITKKPAGNETQTTAAQKRSSSRLPLVRRSLLSASPVAIYALIVIGLALRRRTLVRREFEFRNIRRDGLRFPFGSQELFGDLGISPAVRKLRSGPRAASRRIDFARTVSATAHAMGLTSLQYFRDERHLRYLLLFDRQSVADHQSSSATQLLKRLQAEQIDLEAYEYFGSIAAVVPWQGSDRARASALRLDQVLSLHPQHIVVIFGDPASLRLAHSYQLNPAAQDLLLRRHRILVSSDPGSMDEGDREFLNSLGFGVIEGTSAGLEHLYEIISESGSDNAMTKSSVASSTDTTGSRSLRQRYRRWQQPGTPSTSQIERVIEELQKHLGSPTFDWLCATAVYPTLEPELTKAIGLRVRDERRRPLFSEEGFMKLAQLPWFRTGRMPDWLRQRLVAEMTPVGMKVVQAELGAILLKRRALGSDAMIVPRKGRPWSEVFAILAAKDVTVATRDPVLRRILGLSSLRDALRRWFVLPRLIAFALSLVVCVGIWAALAPVKVQTIVVIVLDGHSFDNLFGNFPGARALNEVIDSQGRPTSDYRAQIDRDGRSTLVTGAWAAC